MSMYMTIAASSLAVGAGIYLLKKLTGGIKAPPGGYKQDVVYLYQFPKSKSMPNMSPFCLKVETFLRINNIKYEVVPTLSGRSRQGLLPFVILNGEQIDDSTLIIVKLTKHFGVKTLDARDEAIGFAVSRLADNHLIYVLQRFKFFGQEGFSFTCNFLRDNGFDRYLPKILFVLFASIVQGIIQRKKGKRLAIALSMFPIEDFDLLLRKDLNSIRDIIGDKKFLFGNEMTSADCTVFAHLATVFWLPYNTHLKRVIDKEYPTIFKYLQSVRQTAYGKSGEEFF